VTTENEVQRLLEVYRGYHAEARFAGSSDSRWDRSVEAERRRAVVALLDDHGLLPLSSRRVLDIGCGAGHVLASLLELGAAPESLVGVDLLPEHVERARSSPPELRFECGNAERLEFADESFDLVLLFTVFTSILDRGMKRNVAQQVERVLRPGGSILWYDFRYDNPSNRNVRGVRAREIRELFPGFAVDLRTVTLVAPLARRLGPLTSALYPVLGAVPLLRTHYAGLLRKPSP
jgi:SAM-dependent methyltransferase